MMKNTVTLENFEKDFVKKSLFNPMDALKLYEAMWEEVLRGVIKTKNYLDGIENDINLAKMLNRFL